MSVEIKIPDVAESITEVAIGEWLKKNGDYVKENDAICEVETDKASQELFAEASGILEILVEEGETVGVGSTIGKINTEAEKPSSQPDSSSSESREGQAEKEASKTTENQEEKKEEAASVAEEEAKTSSNEEPYASEEVVEMRVKELGESITEVTIGEWFKKDGDYVALDEFVCEVETDKAAQELPAEASGILRIEAETGTTLEVGALICRIEVQEKPSKDQTKGDSSANSASSENQTQESQKTKDTAHKETYATGHASPAASKILAEKGISPDEVKGTGVDGRITKEDALKAEKKSEEKEKTVTKEKEAAVSQPTGSTPSGNRGQRRKRMSQLRRTIARRLVSVKNETAMLTTFNEANMKPIMDLRKKYKEGFKEKYGVGLGFMSFFSKACAQALQEFPEVNATLDGNEIVYNDYVDISIAVSTDRGLVVPVLRNVEQMGFADVEQGIVDLAVKARDGKLSIEDMQGGTFTITNGGIFGSMMSTPIINAPQSAILGMHNIVERPYVVNGEITILPMMYLAVSYDHRIVDGKEAVSFLVAIKKYVEEPERLLFGV